MNYIYHIYAKNDPTTLYIGQATNDKGTYKRALAHFSGAWGRSKGWLDESLFGNKSYENPKFQSFILQHALNEIVIEIYDDTYFGIPKNDFERFAAKWFTTSYTTLEVRQKQRANSEETYMLQNGTKYSDQERLNIAEIMHIYYYGTQLGYNVLAMSMGGQNKAMVSTEGNVLNREMSPSQMRTVIERGSTQAFRDLQKVFTEKLQAEMRMKNREDNLAQLIAEVFVGITKVPGDTTNSQINWIIDRWFSKHLEKIIREMQDVMAHTQDGFRIQWPENHTKFVQMKTTHGSVKSLIDLFRITLIDNKKKLQTAVELDMSNKNFNERKLIKNKYENLIETIKNLLSQKIQVGVSIGNFITIKPLSETVKLIATDAIKGGAIITDNSIVQNTLKNISYNFFRRCANMVKEDLQNTVGSSIEDIALNGHFRKTISLDDIEQVNYKIMSIDTFYNKIWDLYKDFKINAYFMRQENWPDFCRGMLTVYTKNNGTIVGGQLELSQLDSLNLGALGEYEAEGKLIIPAYEFTPTTYHFIEENSDMNRDSLIHY